MAKERGAALVIVLAMLSMSLMLGLAGLQSSRIDESLAGNYRAAALAQMGAETAVSRAYADDAALHEDNSFAGVDKPFVDALSWQDFSNGHEEFGNQYQQDSVAYAYRRFRIGGKSYLVGLGAVLGGDDAVVAKSRPLYVELDELSPLSSQRRMRAWR